MMGTDGQPDAGLLVGRPERPVAGVHRHQLVRRPGSHRSHQRALLRQQRQPRARLAADAGLQRVHAEHQLPLDQRQDLPGDDDRGADRADTVGDVKIALDTLFNNPNVGPFIGKQLIQRLVTSDPSPAYVARVAAAFDNNGSGVRGDMKAVWKAILLDPEARTVGTSTSAGKLREPVLRLAHMLRAFNAVSSQRPLHRHRPHRRPGDAPEPDADVRADGVQLLPPRLRAVGHGLSPTRTWSFPRCS